LKLSETNLVQNKTFVLYGWKLASSCDTLTLELLTGLLPSIVIGIPLLLERDASILQKQPIMTSQLIRIIGMSIGSFYVAKFIFHKEHLLDDLTTTELANGKIVVDN
jgi:hypothetical protein